MATRHRVLVCAKEKDNTGHPLHLMYRLELHDNTSRGREILEFLSFLLAWRRHASTSAEGGTEALLDSSSVDMFWTCRNWTWRHVRRRTWTSALLIRSPYVERTSCMHW